MTKHWIAYVLATVGLTALVLWIYKKAAGKEIPPVGREIVSVSTDDPNMVVPDFSNNKPAWNLDDFIRGGKDFVTTYVKE